MKPSVFLAAVLLGALFLTGVVSLTGVLAQDHDDIYDMITREVMRPCGVARSAGLLQGAAPSQAVAAEVAIDLVARAESESAADDGGIADLLAQALR